MHCCQPQEGKLYGPLLQHSAHLARENIRGRMSGCGLTPSQTSVLLYLSQHGQAGQTELAEHMRVKAPTAGGILDRMAEKGLLVRTGEEKDARRRLVCLTEKGTGLVEEIRRKFSQAEEELVRGFTEPERELLRSLLLRIIGNLEGPLC